MRAHSSTGSILHQAAADAAFPTLIRAGAVALAAALTALAAQFTVPLAFTSVPFVLTPVAVLLSGAALGSRLGAASQVVYLAAGVAGLQVFAPSLTLPPGPLRLLGPTGGYLLAYPLAAFVAGWLAERGWDRRYLTSVAAMLAGLAVIYAGGVAWLTGLVGSIDAAVLAGAAPFLGLDLLKIAAAALVLPQVWRLLGRR